jgi:hypothetical protein
LTLSRSERHNVNERRRDRSLFYIMAVGSNENVAWRFGASWHVLTEPKYAGKVVAESQPTDLMAMAGLATGAKQPYNMTPAELSRAQDFLKAAKPAFFKLVSQNSDSARASSGSSTASRSSRPRPTATGSSSS